MRIVVETKRLILREFESEDLDALYLILSDNDVMHYSYEGPLSKEKTKELLERFKKSYKENNFGGWGVIWKETMELIGFCGIIPTEIDGVNNNFLAYRLKKEFWGQKIASEATFGVMVYAFDFLGLDRLAALIKKENIRSARVAERNGMKYLKKTEYEGIILDYYSISQDEFKRVAYV